MNEQTKVEQWGMFELKLNGPKEGNPFVEVELSATFSKDGKSVKVGGFYDGDGVYCFRFMPESLGKWSYVTQSNRPELDGVAGAFECVEPSEGNHGPVRVHDTYHLAYADGTIYYQIGTTCYVWNHQGEELEEQTLRTLASSPFNKIRMCVFPKHYVYNRNEPVYHPFERAGDGWDFTRFHPPFFRHLERRIGDLMRLGIEADIILFHPYDRWGYAKMPPETDDFYLRYVVTRLAAFRNVWWSMANEYDLMKEKTLADWDRFFQIVRSTDPYNHMRGIHNCREFYDHSKPWVTHASIQSSDLHRTREWREKYRKPIIFDECKYEGNIPQGWGNISAEEMVHRFWLGTIGGGYVGHGETYLHPEDILWWSKGGVLHGKSPARIAFLKEIISAGPPKGFDPVDEHGASKGEDYYLYYFGDEEPSEWEFNLPDNAEYKVDLIDTWEMVITPIDGTYSGRFRISLPGKKRMAVRIAKVSDQA